MSWNHRTRVVAMGVAIQAAVGTFVAPNPATDLMAVAQITNQHAQITADDPTATGAVWDAPPVVLGEQATVGATYPMRGPGGAAPPAANVWPMGKVLQSGGYAEIRKAASSAGVLQAGSTTTSLVLANTESAVDDFLLGAPLQQASLGSGFLQTTIIRDYVGATKTAILAETMGAAPAAGAAYTIPAYLAYVLGTLTAPPPVLSISVWRDKKRYDYVDWAPASIVKNMPVANQANTAFGDITFSGRGTCVAVVDDNSPVLPSALLAIPVAPIRGGKFYLDKVKLGHQSVSFNVSYTVGNASNQNQASGQDGTDILSGSRTTSIDLNQMNVSDFDLRARETNRTVVPLLSTWGLGAGNNWGFMQANIVLNPFSPGDRNGYVNLTGDALTTDVDKAQSLTIWWT